MGVGAVYVDLQRLSPIGILNFIQAATNTLKSKPAVVDIEKEFESWDVEEVCRSFLLLLENSSMTKGQLALFRKIRSRVGGDEKPRLTLTSAFVYKKILTEG